MEKTEKKVLEITETHIRELKFRAWDDKRFTYSDEYNSKEKRNENISEFFDDCYGCEIQQAIGMKDKKGEDIYDGDVVRWKQATGGILPADTKPYICLIEWDIFMCGWRCREVISQSCFTLSSSHIEIIGNSFTNNKK